MSNLGKCYGYRVQGPFDPSYNHTAEGNRMGPTLCYRGIDNLSCYRLSPDNRRYYVDYSGDIAGLLVNDQNDQAPMMLGALINQQSTALCVYGNKSRL